MFPFPPTESQESDRDGVDDVYDDENDSDTFVARPMWALYKSTKNTDCLRVNNFSFYKSCTDEDNDTVTWRCSTRKCNATVHTNTSTSTLTSTRNIHNHNPRSAYYFLKLHTHHRVKRRASEFADQRPAKMVILSIDSDDDDHYTDHDLNNLKRAASRAKMQRRFGKVLPRNREEVIKVLEEQIIERSAPGSNLIKHVKNDIVMLATDKSLEFLKEGTYQVLGDGTFRYCPKYFCQLYTIHIFRNGFYLPVVHFLLPNKFKVTYKRMFMTVKQFVGQDMNIPFMNLDFEVGCMNAFKLVFPNSVVRGCRFHIAQAWQRKFRELGFQKVYNSGKGPVCKFLKSIFGVPCMLPDDIPEFFQEHLSKKAPPQLTEFVEYLQKHYMMPNSTFPPQIWAGVGHSDLKYTTNGCENYHSHFKQWFSSPKPDIYTFLENLKLVTRTYTIKSNTPAKPQSPDLNTLHIRHLFRELQKNNISNSDYIALCATGVQPISKTKRSNFRRSQRVLKQVKRRLEKRLRRED